jgi:hypothetical protein
MKKFLVGVFASSILLACNDEKTATPEEKTEAVSGTEKKPAATEVLDLRA